MYSAPCFTSFCYIMTDKINRKLETTDDFDDDAMESELTARGIRSTSTLSSKLSQIVPGKKKMLKVHGFLFLLAPFPPHLSMILCRLLCAWIL